MDNFSFLLFFSHARLISDLYMLFFWLVTGAKREALIMGHAHSLIKMYYATSLPALLSQKGNSAPILKALGSVNHA